MKAKIILNENLLVKNQEMSNARTFLSLFTITEHFGLENLFL